MGKGSSSSGSTGTEAPDSGRSKQFIRIIEVLSEGEIKGLVNGEQSAFLDNTPLMNADGTSNFQNVFYDARAGAQVQDPLDGFDAVEKEVSVGTEVTTRTALTRTVTDSLVTRLRLTLGVSSLFKQEDNGDTNGSSVTFKVTIGSQVYSYTISGKYSSQYLKQYEFSALPAVPFQIKVERVTADSTSSRLQNKTMWASYTEIIDEQFTYPNCAVVGVKLDSDYFSSTPARSYEVYGLIVKIPSNYDPIARTYAEGIWDGTFKLGWTNNPAWVLYDIVSNKRYGLGARLGEFSVDKWTLYSIAQYCDQLVPDGFGGTEPRFTCNLWETEQRSAYDVISDLCSIFRAMPVWTGTHLTAIMDRPYDPVMTYTNANVIEGKFEYAYSALKSRHNAVQVEYLDKSNSYEKAIEYVSDDALIAKYGLNLQKVTAYGCTSRGQAHRTGKWILETEKLETETVTFAVGRDGLILSPGDIIQVADRDFAGAEMGGRVEAVSGKKVTLDREIEINGNSYLTYSNDSALNVDIKISAVAGKVVTLDSTPTGLQVQGVWSLNTATLKTKRYRVMAIAENDDGTYSITGLQHEPQKEAIVDNGASFEAVSTTQYSVPQVSYVAVADNGSGTMNVSWETTSGVGTVSYDIRVLKDGLLYLIKTAQKDSTLELSELPNGDYQVIVLAKNASGQIISEKSENFTVDRPPVPTEVTISAGLTAVSLAWAYINDYTFTEIWASEQNDLTTATRVAKVTAAFYAHEIGASQTRYYWLRHTRGVNLGDFYQQEGLAATTAEDIDAELNALQEKLDYNVMEEAITTAQAARGLETIKIVTELPTAFAQANTLSYNGQLYSWTGSAYELAVQDFSAENLVGTLDKTQLSSTLATEISNATANVAKAQTAIAAETKARTTAITAESTARAQAITAESQARAAAITAEAQARASAIAAETADRTQALQAEANARGTAITALQNVDAQQAGQISQITAKADNALTGIAEERTARIAGDKANADSLSALTTRVGGAESNISALQKTTASNTQAISEAKSSLTAKIDGLQIGGRNYLLNSDFTFSGGNGAKNRSTSLKISSAANHIPVGSVVTVSAHFKLKGVTEIGAGHAMLFLFRLKHEDGTYTYKSISHNAATGEIDKKLSAQVTVTKTSPIVGYGHTYMDIYSITADVAEISKPKIEVGNIATDWSPAPEDVDAELTNANAKITTIQSAVAKTEGDLAATYALKTEVTKGGRTAIAGVQLGAGASGSTLTSEVVISAQRLLIADPNSTNTAAPFAVMTENGTAKVVLNGDMVATGAITSAKLATAAVVAGKLAANSVQSANIQAGAVNADQLAAGAVATDKLAVGLSGNLLQNAIFANPTNGVPYGWTFAKVNTVTANCECMQDSDYGWQTGYLANENVVRWSSSADQGGTGYINLAQKVAVTEGNYYMLSAYVGNHRCILRAYLQFVRENGRAITAPMVEVKTEYPFAGSASAHRLQLKAQAPAGAKAVNVIIRKMATNADASDNSSYMFVARPMLQEIGQYVSEASPWQNTGVTLIHGGSIVTETVTAQQLAVGSVTTAKMVAGSVTSNIIAAGAVNASHIVAQAITADKLNVSNLSAISSDIGYITAGTIQGTTITGNTISGGTINGTTITGGTIQGALIDGVTVRAENIIGDVMRVYSVAYTSPNSSSTTDSTLYLTIPLNKKAQSLYLMPVTMVSTGYLYDASTSDNNTIWKWRVTKSASISIYLNNQLVISKSVGSSESQTVGVEVVEGLFTLPANTVGEIRIDIRNFNGGLSSSNFAFFTNCV